MKFFQSLLKGLQKTLQNQNHHKQNYDIRNNIVDDFQSRFIDEKDYSRLIKIKDAFDGNYLEYENQGDRNKNLLHQECLNEISFAF